MKNSKTKISLIDKVWTEEEAKEGKTLKEGQGRPDPMMIISPYVIFGQKMEARAALQDPWKYCHRVLSLNRYIYIDHIKSLSVNDVMNNHIYGFNCYTLYKTKQFKVTEGSNSSVHTCPELLISFETNS